MALLLPLFLACTGESNTASKNKITTVPLLAFSDKSPSNTREDPENWCFRNFTEAIVVNVPPDNNRARYFRAPPGIFKVIITLGKTASSFIMENTGKPPLKLFHSRHFPLCTSAEKNFKLNTSADGLTYDNQYFINFDLSVSPDEKGYLIRIDYLADLQYGIEVFRCTNCQ